MQLLAQGIERFLKLTYALACFTNKDQLPSIRQLKRLGHDIPEITDQLLVQVSGRCLYVSRPAVVCDLAFIRSDSYIKEALKALGKFGSSSRYHNLDGFLDPSRQSCEDDPKAAWETMEHRIMMHLFADNWMKHVKENSCQVYTMTASFTAGKIHRFMRAVARMWTLGALDDEAKRFKAIISPFLILRDEELGRIR